MSECSTLIVEDETIARENLAHVLERDGCRVRQAVDGQDALKILAQEEFDLVITDLKMPGMSGLEVLEQIKATSPDTEVLVVTGHATVNTAVEAMQKGAYHYLEKPFKIAELRALTEGALEKRRLRLEVKRLRLEMAGGGSVRIVGESPAIRSLKETIAQVAPVDSNVLILGETGTGKELVARAIHMASSRSHKRFLAVNCASFNEELLANELFGHEAGAFTGAKNIKKGLLESANQGTFFLDEIGDMKLEMQAKLLRVLETRSMMRIGGSEEIPIDVRILAATNKDLKKEVAEEQFRQDLFYRLNVITIHVPALAERRQDIPLLCNYFAQTYARAMGKEIAEVSPEVLQILQTYEFPGNIRELANIMERAVVMCNGSTVQPAHLPPDIQGLGWHVIRPCSEAEPGPVELISLKDNEIRHIQRVLEAVDGNKTKAAEILGVDRASLWRKLKRLGLD